MINSKIESKIICIHHFVAVTLVLAGMTLAAVLFVVYQLLVR